MVRNDQEYAEILRQLQELFAEQEAEAEVRRLLGQDEEKGISISAAAEKPSKPKRHRPNRPYGRGFPVQEAKKQGELAELAWQWMAGKNGIWSAKPHGDTLPFDQVAITGKRYDLHKVQVRCTARHENYIYPVSLLKGSRSKRYEPHDFDFLAARSLFRKTPGTSFLTRSSRQLTMSGCIRALSLTQIRTSGTTIATGGT